jgi:phosphatidyl-myo-inositol dimannoside synthase
MSKILILSSEFPPLPGGIGNHALHLAKKLHQNHKTITVLTNQRSKNISDDLLFDKSLVFKTVRIVRNKIVVLTYCNRILKAFSLANKNETIISSGKFSLWIGAFLKLFFINKNYIAVLHGSEINAGGNLSKKITSWSIKKHNKIIAVSNFTKQLMLENNPNLAIEVINNGFEIPNNQYFQPTNTIKGNPAILTIGNVTYRKGQQNVIKAIPLLKQYFPEIHYHIIGIPTEKNVFTNLANSLGVFDNITFHNSISDIERNNILQQAKVFFMLSDNLKNGDVEGFGIAVLEANALNIPAIGSKNTGIVDAISDGFSGKLVNSDKVDEIAVALNEIMNNYEIYSANAAKWSKQFTWEVIIKQYLKAIEA